MLIVTRDNYLIPELQDFIDRKTYVQGIDVEVVTNLTTTALIQEKIITKFNSGGLTYVVLIGRIEDIPSYLYEVDPVKWSPSDPTYTQIEGDDWYGDFLLSRIPAWNTDDLKSALKKIELTETGSFPNKNGVRRALTFGYFGNEDKQNFRTGMLRNPSYFNNTIFGQYDVDLINAINNNDGINIMLYRGHGYEDDIHTESFTYCMYYNSLENYNGPFPILIAMACWIGRFNFTVNGNERYPCFAEEWVTKYNIDGNQQKVPCAGVAALGSSKPLTGSLALYAQNFQEMLFAYDNISGMSEFYYTPEDYVKTLGQLCNISTLFLMAGIDDISAQLLYQGWNLFGDCSMNLCKMVPYSESHSVSSSDEWISRVRVTNVLDNYSDNTEGLGYSNFRAWTNGEVVKGNSYSLRLEPSFNGIPQKQYWRIWIDWNQDGDFDETGERVYSYSTGSTSYVTGTLTIPSSAKTGATCMRVSMKRGALPTQYEIFYNGEVEDYTLIITFPTSYGRYYSREWIGSVYMHNDIYSFENVTGGNGYLYTDNKVCELKTNSSYTITLSPSFNGSPITEYWRVWIDLNRDGDFTDAGETLFQPSGSSSPRTGTISIPSSASTGVTRMRVSMKRSSAPSSTQIFDYGEVEDYLVYME
jgi:hypothetical protein